MAAGAIVMLADGNEQGENASPQRRGRAKPLWRRAGRHQPFLLRSSLEKRKLFFQRKVPVDAGFAELKLPLCFLYHRCDRACARAWAGSSGV